MKKKLKEVKKDNSPSKDVYLINQYNSFKNVNQDYRKIKLNISEDLFVFKDFTFCIAAILAIVAFAVIEKII